jgi:diguanylate cyclase (GGDEF)-like protein
MTTENSSTPRSPRKPPLLKKALKKNRGVRKRMEDCAAELSTVNETVKKEMEAGITLQQAKKALAQSQRVEEKVQDCADELDEINKVLAQEVDDRNKSDHEFIEIREKLSVAESIAEEAKQLSLQDAATGIPNRALFNVRIEQAIALARRNNWFLAVMFIDLDRFKLINDTYGHAAGDKVLQAVAQRLLLRVRSQDTLCRYGGDEFLYLLVNPQGLENIQRIAEEVSEHIAQPVIIDDVELIVEPSIGIAVYPQDGDSSLELVANADAAMYRAKKTRARYTLFNSVKDHSKRA